MAPVKGYFVGLVEKDFLRGKMGAVTPLAWSSWKLHRVAKSSSSAEVQAVTDGMEEMDFCRIAIFELEHGMLGLSDLRNVDDVAASVPAVLVTDGKAGYDALAKNESANLGMRERRTSIECLGIREMQRNTGFILRWVHSDAMLDDGLTKGEAAIRLMGIFL